MAPRAATTASVRTRRLAKKRRDLKARRFCCRVGFSGAALAGTVYLRPKRVKVTSFWREGRGRGAGYLKYI